ncbi:MAG: 30S ribosomal protein S6e [Candidatus Aenigmarchaeota archaeon]|nr:30S ribosomal protein S6e [Candidatus Aenigmarchaeota archaeon]
MAVFKFVISDKKSSVQVEKDQKDAPVFSKKIGEKMSGDFLGLIGYELEITGGSDKDGFPMRKDVEGQVRKKQILIKGIGFHADKEGMRKRRIVRGNTIGADIAQINCKVVKAGEKTVHELLGIKPKEPKKKEVPKQEQEKKEEVKAEASQEQIQQEKEKKEAKKEGTKAEAVA